MKLSYVPIDELENLGLFETLTKRIIKSLAKNYSNDGISATCENLIMNCFNDVIMADLKQEITVAILENLPAFTLASSVYTHNLMIVSAYGETITYKTKTGEKAVNPYNYLCRVIRLYLDKNTNKSVELIIDNDREDGETINVIDMLSERLNKKGYALFEYPEFMHFVSKHVDGVLYDEIADFCMYLCNGYKINAIAEKMNIKETRAYWLRKKIASLFGEYKPIERKTVDFAKVATVDGRETYKRVDVVKATSETLGKKSVVSVCLLPTYTMLENHGDKVMRQVITESINMNVNRDNDGNESRIIVTPIENTRIKRYVVNMTKHNEVESFGIKTKESDKSASGSYQFRYGYTPNYSSMVRIENHEKQEYIRQLYNVPESEKAPIKRAHVKLELMDIRKEKEDRMTYKPSAGKAFKDYPDYVTKSKWSAENVAKHCKRYPETLHK